MVKHIVLFKLKDEAPADKKLTAMKDRSWTQYESRRNLEHCPLQRI